MNAALSRVAWWSQVPWPRVGAFLVHVAVVLALLEVLRRATRALRAAGLRRPPQQHRARFFVLAGLLSRVSAWVWVCGFYTALVWHFGPWLRENGVDWASQFRQERFLLAVGLLCLFSFLGRWFYFTNRRLRDAAASDAAHWETVVAVLVADLLQVGLPLVCAHFVLPLFGLTGQPEGWLRALINLFLIGAGGYLLIRQVNLASDKVTAGHRQFGTQESLRARTLYTQVSVLRKVALAVIVFLTLACMLMIFNTMRQVGTSLLASAGVVTVFAGIAAQKSFGNLVASFQIALTQPILLDDVVVLEGELGRVEEITLYYVVVRLWDQRRMVVPVSYFLEKPFQNWTRRSPEMLGTVFLYLDYHVPLDELRTEFNRVLDASPLWDKRVRSLQVTNANERTLELRALTSAADPDQLWDLRCAVREALVDFLRRKHPASLPRLRLVTEEAPGGGRPPSPASARGEGTAAAGDRSSDGRETANRFGPNGEPAAIVMPRPPANRGGTD